MFADPVLMYVQFSTTTGFWSHSLLLLLSRNVPIAKMPPSNGMSLSSLLGGPLSILVVEVSMMMLLPEKNPKGKSGRNSIITFASHS